MIPKVIHYCWFGGNPLPEMANKCIESWKKYCPDYEIKEWNEENFDINCCDYVREAYRAKKWAFVSDYARFKILYENGGLYFDTDVELIRRIDDIVEKGSFMGCEPILVRNGTDGKYELAVNPGFGLAVAPGLGLAVTPGIALYKEILDEYDKRHFLRPDGSMDKMTVVTFITAILKRHGYIDKGEIQFIAGVYIYPNDYFCPMNYATGRLHITENTRSIHHYMASWHTENENRWIEVEKKIRCKFGWKVGNKIVKSPLMKFIEIIYTKGLRASVFLAVKKVRRMKQEQGG